MCLRILVNLFTLQWTMFKTGFRISLTLVLTVHFSTNKTISKETYLRNKVNVPFSCAYLIMLFL